MEHRQSEELPLGQAPTTAGVRASSRTPRRAARPAARQRKGGETPAVEVPNSPPRKKKSEVLALKHWRVRTVDVQQAEAVAKQRQSDFNDLVRKQYERGVLVDSALGAPGEEGLYGLYRGTRLAELLRADIDGLINFALNQGMIPTMIQEYRGIITNLNETLQGLRMQMATLPVVMQQTVPSPAESAPASAPVVEVAEEVESILGMFFAEADQETGSLEESR
jgi:hypothetical protein